MFGLDKHDSFIRKALKITIFFAVFLTPIIYSSNQFFFFTTPKYVLLSALGSICFVLLGFCLFESKLKIDKKTKITLYLSLAFIVWLFISSYFGIDFTMSFWSDFGRHTGFLTYFFCFILFLSSILVFDKESMYAPLRALAIGGALASISVYLSGALFNVNLFILKNSLNAGTFGNTTYAGIFLVFSLFSCLILFYNEKNKKIRWAWIACFIFILLCPVFLNTKNIFTGNITSIFSLMGEARAGLASVFIGVVFSSILYFYFSSKKVLTTLSKITLVIIFIVGATLVFNLFSSNSKLHNYVLNTKEGVRLAYWNVALLGIGERPLTGLGLESFYQVHKKYFGSTLLSPVYPDEPWSDKLHNNLLEITLSSGIIGLTLYLGFICFILISLIKKAQTSLGEDRAKASLFFGLIVAYLFQAFFAFDTVSSLQAFFVIAALISVYSFGDIEHLERNKIDIYLKTTAYIILILVGALMLYFFSLEVRSESRATRQLNSLSIQKRTSSFAETMDVSPAGRGRSESQYIDQAVALYKAKWSSLSPEVRAGLKKELEFFLKYCQTKSDENPDDFRFPLMAARIGNMLFNISQVKDPALLADSLKYGIHSIETSPYSEMGYKTVVETYLLEKKPNMALKFASMLTGVNPKISNFHDLVIYIAKLGKDQKLIDEKIKEAQGDIPGYEYKF